ncbi:MAG TPA: PASTA domain-containing protein [Deltaproteobacteria bacterium]|nr:PASTA domain-containing protein [Deltaproteobacteria bacterium]
MKRYALALLLVMFMLGGNALAGPLDRMSEPRTNPAVDDMLRIPGVVGLNRSEALITLQQAGLNPVLKIVRSGNSELQGMEGKVIEQSPNPGGVAMIGSSVTVKLYLPPGYEEPAADTWQDDPYQDQYGTYDDQWQGDSYGTDQSGDYQEWSDTPQWPEEDNSGSQWRWQGPVDTQDNATGEFTPAPVKPKEMQPYSPEESPEKDKLIPVLRPKPLQRAQ